MDRSSTLSGRRNCDGVLKSVGDESEDLVMMQMGFGPWLLHLALVIGPSSWLRGGPLNGKVWLCLEQSVRFNVGSKTFVTWLPQLLQWAMLFWQLVFLGVRCLWPLSYCGGFGLGCGVVFGS